MKKVILVLCGLIMAVCAMAIPAKPGLWRMLNLADGSEVRACLCGDEHVHFWMTEDGRRFMKNGDVYEPVDAGQVVSRYMSRRQARSLNSRLLSPKKVTMGQRTHYIGEKKGLVLLVQYSDVKFKTTNNLEKYQKILNEKGYQEGSFVASVTDYFTEQSNGLFELTFDVLGPFTLKYSQKYYGGNDASGNDLRAEEMLIEACKQVDSLVNFNVYDWDGDGEVDQVYLVYAGKGEADSDIANCVWPHMATLTEYGKELALDSVKIDTYACSNELTPSGGICGIGSICHEFSHCMGFPDFYDINYSGNFGMDAFDLMAAGNYNGNGFIPCGYTAHEKMMCGWQQPIVLDSLDVEVDSLLPMSSHGETFIIYNDAWPDEYYMIENRQKTGFDKGYPCAGLLITHVDFDMAVWKNNLPNTNLSKWEASYYGLDVWNDHQRMTLLHADNDDDSAYWVKTNGYGYRYKSTTSTDLYPYWQNDSVTATSKPAPTLYHANSKGKKMADWAITNIKKNADGTMSFKYRAPVPAPSDTTAVDTTVAGRLFYESFDQCSGKGGNDDLWSGVIASATFVPDHEGWSALDNKAYGANACAKFGTSSLPGDVTSPAFILNGEAVLTFKAGAWSADTEPTSLLLEAENATVSPSSFEMKRGAWTDYKAILRGNGEVKIAFSPGRRFFLDEVLVVASDEASGIRTVRSAVMPDRIYTIDGRYVGTDVNALGHGLYIIKGKKIVK